MNKKNKITPFNEDITKWYSDLVLQSGLMSYGPVKGTMFLKPHGFSIWKNIKNILDNEFDKLEVEEVQFPLLLPKSFLTKEKEHIEGFAPEIFTVTKIGEKKLDEELVIRPTSETLFGKFFEENLNSYSQLPMKLNQWVNIMRWENNTRPFLRNSEFFWQEGHTVHTQEKEAHNFSKEILKVYENFANNTLLIPVITGEKTINERFAGAKNTYTIETILKDGQALQSGTSHYLGDKFTKAFNVRVQGKDNKKYNPFQTSWGVSTRLIGAVIMTHSDDKGLILPSKIAPVQIVIMTLFSDKEKRVLELAKKLSKDLNFRVKIDDSNKGIGFKSQEWELKGAPIRIEIGPRDIENNNVTISIRNFSEKIQYNSNEVNNSLIKDLIKKHDDKIYENAKKLKEEKKVEFTSISQIKEIVNKGKYGVAYWTEDLEKEKEIKESTGATIRCLIKSKKEGKSISSNKVTNQIAIFARSY